MNQFYLLREQVTFKKLSLFYTLISHMGHELCLKHIVVTMGHELYLKHIVVTMAGVKTGELLVHHNNCKGIAIIAECCGSW
jgi:hypothetical protein